MGLEWNTKDTLLDIVKRGRDGIDKAGRDMTDRGGQTMTKHVIENTPYGEPNSLDPSPDDFQHLRDHIDQKEVVHVADAWESGSETFVIYAGYVEEGTGLWGPEHRKYIIMPKDPDGVLAFYARDRTPEGRPMLSNSPTENLSHGGLVFARYVMHPGSPGQHMFAIGASITEHELPTIADPVLEEWVRVTEHG